MSPLVMGMSIFLTWKLSKADWQASCLWEKSLNSFQVFVMKEGQSKKSSWNTDYTDSSVSDQLFACFSGFLQKYSSCLQYILVIRGFILDTGFWLKIIREEEKLQSFTKAWAAI